MDQQSAITEVTAGLRAKGLEMAPGAMAPLSKVTFSLLHDIHDHELHFLKTTLIDSIADANRERTKGAEEVNSRDVTVGMIALGKKAGSANANVFDHQVSLTEACPYCKP
ncbi:MAG: hypothetical protein RIG68_09400 [Imperialibacter sp.]|uniref:hypothetical protein n=1 Tax=Imperialibacter sp. TaxID=2038411 RepID=UPI0032F03118